MLYNPWLLILLFSCHCIAILAQYLPWYTEFFVSLLLLDNALLFCLLDNTFSLTHYISLVISFILTLIVHDYLISLLTTNKYVMSNSLIILTQLLDVIISFLFQTSSHLFVLVEWVELNCVVLVCLSSLSFVFMFDLFLWNDCRCIVWLLSTMA